MSLHVHCKTPEARLLIAVSDKKGVFRFPVNADQIVPGLKIAVELGAPIGPQLVEVAEQYFKQQGLGLNVNIEQSYLETIETDVGAVTVYAGSLDKNSDFKAPDEWPTLPELLRKMPKDKNRMAYLKALQVFSGAHTEKIKAVESKDLH